MTSMEPGQIVYIQGLYEGEVVADYGDTIAVKPHEGLSDVDMGKTFTYGRDLIKTERR